MIEVTSRTLKMSVALIIGAVVFASLMVAWTLGAFEKSAPPPLPYAAVEAHEAFIPWVAWHRRLETPPDNARRIVSTWLVNGQARTLICDQGSSPQMLSVPGEQPQGFNVSPTQRGAFSTLFDELPPEVDPDSAETSILFSYYDGDRWQYLIYDVFLREPQYQTLRAALGLR